MASNAALMVAVVVIIILAIALYMTSSIFHPDPKQLFRNYMALEGSAPSYQVSYNMQDPSLTTALSYFGANTSVTQVEFFKNGQQTKFAADVGSIILAQYYINGTETTCHEYTGSQSSISCSSFGTSLNETSSRINLLNTINQTNITYLGSSQHIGMQCDNFRIASSANDLSNVLAQWENSLGLDVPREGNYNGSDVAYACIDTQTGMPLELNITNSYYSPLLSENKTMLIVSLNATSLSTQASNQSFAIPQSTQQGPSSVTVVSK